MSSHGKGEIVLPVLVFLASILCLAGSFQPWFAGLAGMMAAGKGAAISQIKLITAGVSGVALLFSVISMGTQSFGPLQGFIFLGLAGGIGFYPGKIWYTFDPMSSNTSMVFNIIGVGLHMVSIGVVMLACLGVVGIIRGARSKVTSI